MAHIKRKVCFLNSHPIQYFAPMYRYMSKSDDLTFHVLYLSDSSIRGATDAGFAQDVKWDIDLLSGYSSCFVGKRFNKRVPDGFFSLIAPEIWKTVRSVNCDALVIHGHGYCANVLAFAAAKSVGIPVFMRGETHLGLTRSKFRSFVRNRMLSWLYAYCSGVLAIGTANKEFYVSIGVPEAKIHLVPYTVDNERFSEAARLSDEEKSAVRRQLGIEGDAPVIVYAGKFQLRKHPGDVLRAAKQLSNDGLEFNLVMAGSGELGPALKELARELELKNVFFPGFINQASLPGVLGACDIFVLPSEEEPWGLIVNEAMCAAMPVVVASGVGCVRDLVRVGKNGLTFPVGNVDRLADALRALVVDPQKVREMGRESRLMIDHWSYRQCLDGVRLALNSAKKSKSIQTLEKISE
jgi:glycosyltransferase involved in cell wall biosynthesis